MRRVGRSLRRPARAAPTRCVSASTAAPTWTGTRRPYIACGKGISTRRDCARNAASGRTKDAKKPWRLPITVATRTWRPGWRKFAGWTRHLSEPRYWWFCGLPPREAGRGDSARFTARRSCWTSSFPASRRRCKQTSKQRVLVCRTSSSRLSPATTGAASSLNRKSAGMIFRTSSQAGSGAYVTSA